MNEAQRARKRANTKAWRERNPGKEAEIKRAYRASDKGRRAERSADLRKRYGITESDYEALYQKQGGVCAICGKSETVPHGKTGKPGRLSVDHCHKTGQVRGLLCSRHNLMIGLMQDDPETADRAAAYLRSLKEELFQ